MPREKDLGKVLGLSVPRSFTSPAMNKTRGHRKKVIKSERSCQSTHLFTSYWYEPWTSVSRESKSPSLHFVLHFFFFTSYRYEPSRSGTPRARFRAKSIFVSFRYPFLFLLFLFQKELSSATWKKNPSPFRKAIFTQPISASHRVGFPCVFE